MFSSVTAQNKWDFCYGDVIAIDFLMPGTSRYKMDESILFLKLDPDISIAVIYSDRELGIDFDAMQFGPDQHNHDEANTLLLSAFGYVALGLIHLRLRHGVWCIIQITHNADFNPTTSISYTFQA